MPERWLRIDKMQIHRPDRVNNPDLVRSYLKLSEPSVKLTGVICATRLCQSLSLVPSNVLRKEILKGRVAITFATVA